MAGQAAGNHADAPFRSFQLEMCRPTHLGRHIGPVLRVKFAERPTYPHPQREGRPSRARPDASPRR